MSSLFFDIYDNILSYISKVNSGFNYLYEMADKKLPITRLNKWFSESDFNLEIRMGREYVEGDNNFKVVLYRVDRERTTTDIYNEAAKESIIYKTPIEINVLPVVSEAENIAFNQNSGSMRDLQDGKFIFSVYESHLKELDVDISYGDYIGYQVNQTDMRYYSVTNDGKKIYDNKHTIMGYMGAYRTVECSPVDYNEFNGF